MKSTYALISVLTMTFFACTTSTVTLSPEEKLCLTVAVLPFDRLDHFPYTKDIIREAFLIEFASRGFDRSYADKYWKTIDTMFASLVSLNEENAKTVAQLLNVDLLITGDIRELKKSGRTWSGARVSATTIIVKVFHTKMNKFILNESQNSSERWGLGGETRNAAAHAKMFVDKLARLGYVK